MGYQRLILLTLPVFFLLGACGTSLHTVYMDADRGVYLEGPKGERIECQQAYSSWDGSEHYDYYGAPCFIFIKRRIKEIPNASDPRTRH